MIRLRLLRCERGITVRDLAKALGINRMYLGSFETGRMNPNDSEIAKLVEYFGVPANALFAHVNDPYLPDVPANTRTLLLANED